MTGRDATDARSSPDDAPPQLDFTELYRTHLGSLRAYAGACVPPADADDVVSEVFIVALRRQEEIPTEWTRGWLIGVTRNVVRSRRRSERRRTNFLGELATQRPEHVGEPGDRHAATEAFDALEASMAQLRPTDQELLMFAGPYAMSNGDIAAALDITENNAAVRLHRARQRLRAEFERITAEGGEVA